MTENKLNGFSTLAIGEEGHTTMISGEECQLSPAQAEGKLDAADLSRKGGPFGAY